MDEISKKFVVKDQTNLQSMEQRIEAATKTLRDSRVGVLLEARRASALNLLRARPLQNNTWRVCLAQRYGELKLKKETDKVLLIHGHRATALEKAL
jgi:hypothetical protein